MAFRLAASRASSAKQLYKSSAPAAPAFTATAVAHHHPQAGPAHQTAHTPSVRQVYLGIRTSVLSPLHRSFSVSTSAASVSSSTAGAQTQPIKMSDGKVAVRDTISLNPQEQELFGVLLAATQHAGSNTVLRCAGGWVRDKLLGRESHDIDIALDNMLGKDFAELVNQYLKSQGKEVRTAAVIHSNPDQSKHLETARMKINDLWIDLVNLRSETYAQDSRIPEMQFGTAEQDALRRDFTINSLFYNLNQSCVEDLTGRGLQDLRDGHIRTPLPPKETFMDDPLRVLRAVRFGTRFGFDLSTDILEAASSPEVRTALGQKVSKERIGTELDGMFNGQKPSAAILLLHTLSLFPIVFALPPDTARAVGDEYAPACVSCMQTTEQLLDKVGLQLDLEERRFLLLAGLLLPLRACQCPGAKNKPQPAVQCVVRESVKWRAKDADMSVLLHEVAPSLLEVYVQLTAAGGPSQPAAVPESTKVALGTVIRRLKQHWRLGMLLAPVVACKSARALGVEAGTAAPCLPELGSQEEEAARNVEVYSTLMAASEAFGLQDCWQWKPLLDGKQVMELLDLKKPGPQLGKAMAAAADWQLVHPQGSLEDCRTYLAQWWSTNQ